MLLNNEEPYASDKSLFIDSKSEIALYEFLVSLEIEVSSFKTHTEYSTLVSSSATTSKLPLSKQVYLYLYLKTKKDRSMHH